jgi:ribonuclease E
VESFTSRLGRWDATLGNFRTSSEKEKKFLMTKKMLINASHAEECRVAVVCDGILEELDVQVMTREATLGNIYKGVTSRIEPSLQAVFVDYGAPRNGFLSINDVHPSYFPESFEGSRRRPRIQDVFKKDDHVLVQVNKEERATKGASLTTNISLAGRYLVLMPGTDLYGVSRKIEDENERKKLKEMLKQFKLPENMGFIIRTAGMGRTKTELARDLEYLLKLWKSIEENVAKEEAPVLLYKEHDVVIRSIREHFSHDISELLVDDKEVHKKVRDFFHQVMPKYENLVKFYQEKRPLFNKYQLEEQLEQVYQRRIKLKSGGYILIEPTEALVTVDVNSGSATKEKGIEDTAFRVNMEAAPEIARQLRLRDLGGIIVIDFIDMTQKKHKQEVERALKMVLKDDRAKSKVLRISLLGLLELSRQRLKSSLGTGEYLDCPLCDGRGKIRSPETSALSVFRRIKSLLIKQDVSEVRATVPSKVADYLLNRMRPQLVELENQYGTRVNILVRQTIPDKDVIVEAVKEEVSEQPLQPLQPVLEAIPVPIMPAEAVTTAEDEAAEETEEAKPRKPGRRRRRSRRKPASEGAVESAEGESGEETPVQSQFLDEQALPEAVSAAPCEEAQSQVVEEPAAEEPSNAVRSEEIRHLFVEEGASHPKTQEEAQQPVDVRQKEGAATVASEEIPAQSGEWGENPRDLAVKEEVAEVTDLCAESKESPETAEPEPSTETNEEPKEKNPPPRKSLLQSYLPFS